MRIQNPFTFGLIATLGVGVGLLGWSIFSNLATILTYIGVAIFIALGLDPIVRWLERNRFPRWLAVLTVVAGILLVMTGIVFAVVPTIASEAAGVIEQVSGIDYNQAFVDTIANVQSWLQTAFGITTEQFDLQSEINKGLNALLTDGGWANLSGGIIGVGFGILNGLFGVFIVLILMLYFVASLPNIKRALYQLVPSSRRVRFAELSEQITDSVGKYVIGQVSVALINGTASFIVMTVLGAPFPTVLAVISFLLALIPLVGALAGAVVNSLLVLAFYDPGSSWLNGWLPWVADWVPLIVPIYYLIYMQVEANLVSPRIMTRAVAVPGAIVVIAALAGGTLLGVLGALIAIPVAASVLIIIRQVWVPRQNEL